MLNNMIMGKIKMEDEKMELSDTFLTNQIFSGTPPPRGGVLVKGYDNE